MNKLLDVSSSDTFSSLGNAVLDDIRELLCMLVLVTTKITKIHGIHPCKDGMAYNKTHVELRIIACTH